MKILIVDDSNLIRRAPARLLEQKGCEVHDVENGEGAVWRVLDEPFDAVVTDYRMPRMSGLELTATLRTLFGPQIQVVGMSTSEEDCQPEFERAGCQIFDLTLN